MTLDAFAHHLLDWHARNGRHDLPWQHPRTPYRVWISEVMLQQTQVATVIPYFDRFVAALPDIHALATADEDRVLALWSGLGYYRRARHLHAAARICVAEHAGKLPRDFDALAALPGIGRSTAGAILALSQGQRHAILDGNVKRVLARFHGISGWPGERIVEKKLWACAEAHTPTKHVADYTQAIMDLGATVCTRATPHCDTCPQARKCLARIRGLTVELPQRRPTRVLPERQTVFVVLRDANDRVLLQRRPPHGVWPGLWSLPEAADAGAAQLVANRFAVLDGAIVGALPEIRHVFTHFRLRATPLEWRKVRANHVIADNPDSHWCSLGDLAILGIPAPVLKFLRSSMIAASPDDPRRLNITGQAPPERPSLGINCDHP